MKKVIQQGKNRGERKDVKIVWLICLLPYVKTDIFQLVNFALHCIVTLLGLTSMQTHLPIFEFEINNKSLIVDIKK